MTIKMVYCSLGVVVHMSVSNKKRCFTYLVKTDEIKENILSRSFLFIILIFRLGREHN